MEQMAGDGTERATLDVTKDKDSFQLSVADRNWAILAATFHPPFG
jgi:hypothetical protein